ncbi:MAG TPA: methyltransferase domain-containing protein [Phycisphaerae bacterium]|nr:methyltransferase domain-containing protein [Phycisphaerae bacterium]
MATKMIEQSTGAVFCDRSGNTCELKAGHRDELKPGWSKMLEDQPSSPSDAEIVREMDGVSSRLKLATRMLAAFGGRIDVDDALVVGCGDAVEPMFVASAGARSVVGTDLALTGDSERLRRIADRFLIENGQSIPKPRAAEMREDNIACSNLPNQSFDLVCSWRTLEHIGDPRAAFAEMYRVLRPGGYAYHEYNPFFAIDGGHSLVTLDIPWGHVRFDRSDIERYVQQFRSNETERALGYYDNCLNRMTIADLNGFATSAGFETLAVIPRTRTEDLIRVDAKLLNPAQQNYPGTTLNDLISRIVRVVMRRPNGG